MRICCTTLLLFSALLAGSCTFQDDATARERERQRQEQLSRDADSAAGKAGKAAHEIATESEELARKAGRKLQEAARQAKAGWKEAEHEDRVKGK